MKKFLALIFLATSCLLHAQTTFQKTYGGNNTDIAKCVKQTSDGGYIITGSTYTSGAGNGDIYVIKTDNIGDTLWKRKYGSGSADLGYSGQQTVDGGYIICGSTSGFSAPGSKMYLLKTDANGNLLWSKVFLNGSLYSVLQANDGGYLLTGQASGGLVVIKTDSAGDTLWTKMFGATGVNIGACINKTFDDGFVIAGYTNSFGAGNFDMLLLRLDSLGNMLFRKTYGGISEDRATSVQQTADSGFVLCGYTGSFGAGQHDIFLLKTDGSGNLQWNKTFGGTNDDEANSVQQTSDGGYVLAGYANYSLSSTSGHVSLIKCDSAGNLSWSHVYGKSSYNDWGYSAVQTLDGGYIMAGTTYSFGGFGGQYDDVYLIKTDSSGNSGCYEPSYPMVANTHVCQFASLAVPPSSGLTELTHATIVNSGGFDSTHCFVLVSITETAYIKNRVSVTPNPFNTYITINGTIENGEASLFSMDGQLLLQQETYATQTKIYTGKLPAGMYILRYKYLNNVQYLKLIKK